MGLGPRIDIRQSQSLVLTPQLTQAIKLLQLSNLELEAFIAEEISKNPLIEEIGGEEEGEAPVVAAALADAEGGSEFGGAGEGGSDDAPPDPGADELIASLNASDDQPLDIDWRDQALETDSFADVAGSSSAGGGDEGFDFDRIEAGEASLSEHLLSQLHGIGGADGALARAIAETLDETGYLSVPLSEIADDHKVSRADAERALAIVQTLDPPGVGARNLAECLALQARAADRYDPAMARLIDNLELLSRGQMAALKRICGVDDEDLADMVRELRAYDPKPGCRFSSEAAADVTPDVFIRRTAQGYAVELNAATLPRLLVNRRYYQELKTGPQDKASKAWLSECLTSANWLVKALDQRARTIVKVVSEIVKRQHGFFERGVSGLKPLTLREVGDSIEMHESTVSRVTSNKYVLCDRGLFELKFFFSSGVGSSEEGGEGAAAGAVKAAIGELIAKENDILSDDTLVELLKDRGFDLARRTVAKYREAMGIGSSIQRRRERKISGS